LQGISDQLHRHALRHRPTDDAAGKEVQHHRQIQPALVGPKVGDIAVSFLVLGTGAEVLCQQVVGHWQVMSALGGDLEFPGGIVA